MLLDFFVLMVLAGGVLSLALFVFRRLPLPDALASRAWIRRLYSSDTGVPYGIAIAAGALLVYPEVPWIKAFLA